jgi:hypothetical protein
MSSGASRGRRAASNGAPKDDEGREIILLSAETILETDDTQEKYVYVEAWGGHVKIRTFSKRKQQALRNEAIIGEDIDNEKFEMLLFIHGVVEPEFTIDQIEELREKNANALDAVILEVTTLGGLTPRAVKEAEARFPARS